MERPKTQILVCGDVGGKFDELYQRVNDIQKKQSFDVLLCVGRFFEDEANLEAFKDYRSGTKKASILTYFILPLDEIDFLPPELKNGGELCENINFLGVMGTKEIKGITIAYFSPTTMDLDQNTKESVLQFHASFNINSFKGVDILLTNQWPKGILNKITDPNMAISGMSMLEYDNVGDDIITTTVNATLPRYHFSCGPKKNIYFERPPYKNIKQFNDSKYELL
jgi:hypothetical protein